MCTVLADEIGESSEVQLNDFSTGINLAEYKRKLEASIRGSENHVVLAKFRLIRPLTATDLLELERFVLEAGAVESRARFEQAYCDGTSLPVFIRSLVGLDRGAAKEAFAKFLDGTRFSSQQIRFVEMIVERLTRNSAMVPKRLYEASFTGVHHEGLDEIFGNYEADEIAGVISKIDMTLAA